MDYHTAEFNHLHGGMQRTTPGGQSRQPNAF